MFGHRKLKFEIGTSAGDDAMSVSADAEEIAPPCIEAYSGPHRSLPQASNGAQQPYASPRSLPHQRRVARAEPRLQNPAVSFWDALDPTEREAVRSMASLRTFAAGATLMHEGERADHVIVILGGRTRICVDENGRERVLAERGLGQLVGERGALQVSVRSATVIALEMVWALVVQTKDFAAFISAHPRVLALVQHQRYERDSEEPVEYGHDNGGRDRFRAGPASSMAVTDQPGNDLAAEHSQQHPQPFNGENCTVLLSDVVAFGARTRNDKDRRIIREALFGMTHLALRGIPDVWSEDRGDGLLTVVPPSVSTGRVLDQVLKKLLTALEWHNFAQRDSARFQLRFAVNVGPVVSDTMGVSGEAIIVVARLVEASSFKQAIAKSTASLGVIASPFVYETVIRHGSNPSDVGAYSQVPVEVKESYTTAWIKLFDSTVPSSLVPHTAAQPTMAEEALWMALCMAPEDGIGVGDLMRATGMTRSTIYRHLREHVRTAQAVQVSRGRWRARTTEEPSP